MNEHVLFLDPYTSIKIWVINGFCNRTFMNIKMVDINEKYGHHLDINKNIVSLLFLLLNIFCH